MKKVVIFTFAFLSLFVLTACGKQETQVNSDTNGSQPRDFRRPDFGQPETDSNLRGLVSSVVGNEVTILKIERPEGAGQGDGKGMPDMANLDQDMTEEKTEQQQTAFGATGGMGGGPGGGPGMMGGGRPGEDMDGDAQNAMLERIKEMSAGEETVLVPVGIQMLKPNTESDSKELEMVEATLEDIKENTMIEVWLNDSVTDRQVASFVLIMQ